MRTLQTRKITANIRQLESELRNAPSPPLRDLGIASNANSGNEIARTAEIPGKSAWVGKFGLASYRCPNNPEFEDWFCTAHIFHPDSLHEFCGSFYVSVKLPTYPPPPPCPSPKPKLTLSSYLGQNFGLGKG